MQNGDRIRSSWKEARCQDPWDGQDQYRVESDRVEDEQGVFHFGSFEQPSRPRILVVRTDTGKVELDMEHVVHLRSIRESFWDRLEGSLGGAYNFTKVTGLSSLTGNFIATYPTERYRLQVSANSFIQEQNQIESARRWDVSVAGTRHLGRRWFTGMSLKVEENEQLGIDLRTSLSAVGDGSRASHSWCQAVSKAPRVATVSSR